MAEAQPLCVQSSSFPNIQMQEDQMRIHMLQKIYTEITCRERLWQFYRGF